MRRVLPAILDLCAWSWAIYSLYAVVRYGGAVIADPSTTSRIMAVGVDGEIHSAIGLTYSGILGGVLVLVEIVVVGTALWWSQKGGFGLVDETHAVSATLRRGALVVLAAWSLLWLANAAWIESLSGGRHATRTTVVAIAAAVMLARAYARWTLTGEADSRARAASPSHGYETSTG